MINLLKILLWPFSVLYRVVIIIRNRLFDKGYFKSSKSAAKIISIGNITVGGSGKTPTVIYVTNLLKKNDLKPGILSRGYGRDSKGYLKVSGYNGPEVKVNTCGDEIFLAADECLVPTAVCEKRVTGAKNLLKEEQLDAIVLDDAFQHRWISRDLDILLFDQRFLGKTGKLEQNLLPTGHLREPFSSINRADIVVINRKFSEKKEIPQNLKKHFRDSEIFYSHYEVDGIFDLKDHKYYSLDEFRGQKSLIVSGIARPYSFLRVLEKNGIDFSNKLLFTDHRDYDNKDVQKIRKAFYDSNAYSVLTTQKDAVKLTNFTKELDDIDIYYLKIGIKIEQEKKFEERIMNIFH